MITSGTVSFEDGRKAAEEYAPARKVRVELSFTVDEGTDHQAAIRYAGQSAKAMVKELIYGTTSAPKSDTVSEIAEVLATPAPVAAAPKKTRAAKAPKVEPLPAVETFPSASDGGQTAAGTGASAAGPAKVTEDLSDAALYKVVVDINQRIAKPKEITAIIEKFCPQDGVPPSLKRVIDAKRSEFLVELRAFAEKSKGVAKDEVQVS